jgi:hypothetical protein
MTTREILDIGTAYLQELEGHVFDVITLSKPVTVNSAVNLAKVVSKLSPLLANMIEFNTVEILNSKPEFKSDGVWARQDPGFPDMVFQGKVKPMPGFEIKAWFPLSTEITARFKDSQNHFLEENTDVAMLVWLPEHLIYGKPVIIDVCVVSPEERRPRPSMRYDNQVGRVGLPHWKKRCRLVNWLGCVNG